LQGSLIFLIVVLIALPVAGWWVLSTRNRNAPVAMIPSYTVRKSVLAPQELAYQKVVQQIMGEDSIIFAKVGLAHILDFPGNHPHFRKHWARAQRRSVDFLVCDSALAPVLAIKFDANPARRHKSNREDVLKDCLDAADLPLLIVRPAESYQLEEVNFRIKYALSQQDSTLNDDGSVIHEADLEDLEDDEFSDSLLPKFKRWTSDLWDTAARRLH